MNQRIEDPNTSSQSAMEREEDGADTSLEEYGPLLAEQDVDMFRGDWQEIQVKFVDEPHVAVEEADELVAGVMRRLSGTFAEERSRLEQEWSRGNEVSTEALRQAFQHYRSFFDRLLSA